jgi:hypothetical protein
MSIKKKKRSEIPPDETQITTINLERAGYLEQLASVNHLSSRTSLVNYCVREKVLEMLKSGELKDV